MFSSSQLEFIGVFFDGIRAIATIAIPILLIYWAPKLTRSDQQYAKEAIETEFKEYLNKVKAVVAEALNTFPEKGYGVELEEEEQKYLKSHSTQIQAQVDIAIAAYRQAMTDSGKGNLTMNIKVIEAQEINLEMSNVRKADLAEWVDNPNKKITTASAHTHFRMIGDSIDKIEQSILPAG